MSSYLIHHGVKGQKWGVRRFQNDDGSLTTLGKKRYRTETPQETARRQMSEAEAKYEKRRVSRANRKDIVRYGLVGHAIRKKRGAVEVEPRKKDSAVTRRVKKDFEELDDKQFRTKYYVDKKVYAKRVAKYGDPYMNSPITKWAKDQNKKIRERQIKEEQDTVGRALKMDKKLVDDIESFKGHEKGIYDKRGRMMLSEKDVSDSVRSLQEQRLNNISRTDYYKSGQKATERLLDELSSSYDIHYDVARKRYSLSDKT